MLRVLSVEIIAKQMGRLNQNVTLTDNGPRATIWNDFNQYFIYLQEEV